MIVFLLPRSFVGEGSGAPNPSFTVKHAFLK
ncbi:hypothetical protein GGQ85_003152 [Nitrobacter vulgaris]|jgi:hypothetical protein|nr:hypothetical protein [Nitrobacter vulgaris]